MTRQGFIFFVVTEDSSHVFHSTALTLVEATQELENDGDCKEDVVKILELHSKSPVQVHTLNSRLQDNS